MDEVSEKNNSKHDKQNNHHDVIPGIDKPGHILFEILFEVAHTNE
jgi:hypothetical protein